MPITEEMPAMGNEFGLELFVRDTRLSEEKWMCAIGQRVIVMRLLMRDMNFSPLRKLFSKHFMDTPEFSQTWGETLFKMSGFFVFTEGTDTISYIWGYARSKGWILCKVKHEGEEKNAYDLSIGDTPLDEISAIIKEPYESMWYALNRVYYDEVELRRVQMKRLETFYKNFKEEEQAARMMNRMIYIREESEKQTTV